MRSDEHETEPERRRGAWPSGATSHADCRTTGRVGNRWRASTLHVSDGATKKRYRDGSGCYQTLIFSPGGRDANAPLLKRLEGISYPKSQKPLTCFATRRFLFSRDRALPTPCDLLCCIQGDQSAGCGRESTIAGRHRGWLASLASMAGARMAVPRKNCAPRATA
jgi:hypothetical protein